ncbi:PREDICTED: post-GPI attachment to proteins factor 3 [Nicrophorus vespilloides]|uniref:Post-GPI attachment to proteins factor 3 n=1 Tax=Nicrophorus vespilloides TaxID=110193 RepID=A0ABM1MZL8_NICVS|nr:PREDICTED: post-GPI attachment to proteins factor 3 [Nicrophorus vespilloides]
MKFLFWGWFGVFLLLNSSDASTGDRSTHFRNCMRRCEFERCENGGSDFAAREIQPVHLWLMQWTCTDECKYDCMWRTVDAYNKRNYKTPQFYGKWPFIRIFGVQEPASVLFSLFNFYANLQGILNFRKTVRPDAPMFWFWHFFCIVSLNGWFWSTVFHARDFPNTEFMDYSCAFSMVLMSCYCMIMRFMKDFPRFLKIAVTVFFIAFYANHVTYLKLGKFDYLYNMQVNILVGTFTAIFWFAWAIYNRFRLPYVWKIAAFVSVACVSTLLEVLDYPPLFYILDCHALWHLSTVPLVYLFYSFITDDCVFLRKEQAERLDVEKVKKHN